MHHRGWFPETQTNRLNRCSIHGFLFTAEMAVVGTYDLSDELACPCTPAECGGGRAHSRRQRADAEYAQPTHARLIHPALFAQYYWATCLFSFRLAKPAHRSFLI